MRPIGSWQALVLGTALSALAPGAGAADTFRKLLPAAKVTRYFQIENKLDAVVNYDLAAAIPLVRSAAK
jgi:hypothetical protein